MRDLPTQGASRSLRLDPGGLERDVDLAEEEIAIPVFEVSGLREVLDRDRAFTELAVLHARVENPGDPPADAARGRLGQRAGRRFHRVRQHEHRRLLRARLRARIAEIPLLDGWVRLLRLVEEE